MIQRHGDAETLDENGVPLAADPFKPEEASPLVSGAISSSCWELASLQKHYLASVSTLAKVFTEIFTKPEYNMEDFLDHGYDTVS
jgi:U3 small nucleolar RNA-associated protein 19